MSALEFDSSSEAGASMHGASGAADTKAASVPPGYPGHDQFLPYLMNKATMLLNAPVQRMLDAEGLTLTHWRVLAFLSSQDGLTVSGLAEATMTEQSTLSRSLRTLETLGFVARQGSDQDSRAVHIHLRDEGRAAFRRILDKALAIEGRFMRGIDEAEQAALRSVLLRLIANA
ncbi:MarR family transcriptional regulator [soil metagenome]